jgi:glycosyltransferase involved in cell wall biosynthesis
MADYLHVQNEYQRKILVDYYHVAPQKIFIIPNPVDIKLFSSKSHKISKSSSTKTLLIVSRIVPWKGIDTAIKALALVLKKDSSFELKIIGDGSFECVKSLKLLGMRLGIEKKIHFAGRVANANLPLEYARCKVFLQPSLYEPFGISAIESFSCGRPAVVSNVGGLVELAKGAPAALMFEKGNETDLAKKILLAGKFSSAQCSKNILFAKKYEIKKIVKLLESFYIQINPK